MSPPARRCASATSPQSRRTRWPTHRWYETRHRPSISVLALRLSSRFSVMTVAVRHRPDGQGVALRRCRSAGARQVLSIEVEQLAQKGFLLSVGTAICLIGVARVIAVPPVGAAVPVVVARVFHGWTAR